MINGDQSAVRPADLATGVLETLKGLRRGHFVNQMSVNVQQDGAIFLLVDDVVLQDLVIQGLGRLIGARHEGQRNSQVM